MYVYIKFKKTYVSSRETHFKFETNLEKSRWRVRKKKEEKINTNSHISLEQTVCST